MRMNLWLIVLAAVAFPAVAAANPGVSGSLLLNPLLEVSVQAKVPDAPAAGASLAPPTFALTPSFASLVRYRPDPYRPRAYRSPMSTIPLSAQIHVGFFDPIDNFSTGFDGGFRVGPQVSPNIQLGLAMDWWHRSDNKVLNLGTVEVPVGTASEQLILSESTANLIPILVFVQVSGDENMSVIPYGGVGIGYEWLFLTANDYVTRESFDETFGGFGWQIWVGAGLPLESRMRVNGELFFNDCEVGTDVDVNIPNYGPATVRDVVKMNGIGLRLGVSWMF
ncbi:MAG: hypothetical protein ABR899_01560 [Candidatus Krumholzibacteriaceae bacterium]|jgi:outer membrane protein W